MANLSASFLQRKNQILGIKTNAKTPSVSSSTKSILSTGFLERKKQILTPKPVATTQPIEPLKSSALTLPTTPISGNMGVGSNQIAYPKQATATPEQNRVAMKAIDIVKNTRNAINDGIAVAGTPLKIFFPTPVYAPEDYEDAKKLASEYEKSANLKVNKVANQFSSGLYTGMTGGIIKPSVGEAKTIPEKVASGTGALLGTYYTMVKIGAFADKVLFPGKAIETTLKLSPTVAKYVVPIVKNVATFDIYGQLDPDTQDRAKKMFMDTVTAIPFTLLGNIQKGIYKVPATFALGYSMAKAAGASTEDALINGSLLALLAATEALTSPRTKNLNTRQLTPEEIRAEVFRQNKQNTQQGKDLLQIANQAEQTGSKAELQVNQVKSSILEDILGKKTSITQVKVDYVKNPDIIGGKENVSAPATPETQVAPKGIIPPIIPQQPPVIPPKKIVTSPQPPETTKETKPVEKAVEKPTAESLIKEKGYELASVDIKDNENFIVENLDGKPAKLMEIPLSEFGKPKFETATNYKYEPGRKITSPIEVTILEGKLKITDGANRFEQAYNNKDKTILAVVENYEQYKPVKEKAQKVEKEPVEKPIIGKSAAEQENLPYTERTYYRGLQGKALEEYRKTGILPKAQQAFGGDYSITSDYETAQDYAGEKGIVVEIKLKKDAGISEADPFDKKSLEENWNDIQDIGDGEMIVNNPSKIRVINRPKVSIKKKTISPKVEKEVIEKIPIEKLETIKSKQEVLKEGDYEIGKIIYKELDGKMYVENIAIAPPFRNKGLATKALNRIKEQNGFNEVIPVNIQKESVGFWNKYKKPPKVTQKKKPTSPKAAEQTKKEGVVETPTQPIKTGGEINSPSITSNRPDLTNEKLNKGFGEIDDLHTIDPKTGKLISKPDVPIKTGGESISQNNGINNKTVYHGTRNEFDKFDDTKLGTNTEWLNSKWGHFFTEDKNIAKRFLNEDTIGIKDTRTGRIIEAKIDLKKPLDFTPEGLTTNKEQAQIIYEAMTGKKVSPNNALRLVKNAYEDATGLGSVDDFYDELYGNLKIKELAQKNGYDGLISHYGELDGKNIKEYAVFSSNQIKNQSPLSPESVSPIKTGGDEKQAQKPKELTLAPSKATSEKKLLKEVAKADVAQHFNFNKGTYNKPAITKNDIKIFLSDKDFAANPVFTVVKTEELLPSGDNLTVLEYKSPKLEITLDPRGLQINPEKLKPGTKIRVDIEAIKKYPGVSQTRIYNQGKVFASTGAFADIKNLTEKFETKSTPEMRIVEMPEMVRLATQLMEGVPEIKRSRARKNLGVPNGLFRGDGKGKIYLNPDIFKTPGQAAKTLAHEMGHLADYLPDHTLSRGNVIGRVATLNKFLRSTFSGHLTEQKVDELMRQRNDLREQRKELKDENGVVSDRAIDNRILTELKKVNTEIKKLRSGESISDSKIRKELKRLSRKWKPFDPKQNPKFTKYRYSPPELYADALSVLFNDPLLLETKAPKFYEAFFKYLDQKPEYKKELLDLQTTLLAGDDQVMNLRLTEIAKNYKEGNAAWLAKHAEKQNNFFNIMGELNTNFVNKDYNLTKKVNEAVKQGKSVDPEINPIFTQGGLNYLDGEVKNVIVDSYQKVHTYTSKIPQISITTNISGKTETLSLNGWESLGMITQLERSMFERGELANPGGYDPKTAKETLAVLKSKYETKDWKKLQKAKRLFRRGTIAINKMALEHGFRTPELSAELMANKTYATFQVLDYIDTYISPAIYKQTGTLKAVANPATATVMKAVATVRAILYNDAKNANLDFLTQVDPENVVPAKTRFNGKYKEPIESRDPDKVLVKSVRDGKVVGVYVDKDLNLIFNHTTETTLRSLGKLSKLLTGAGLYRPIFTSINLGFQLFNFQKDFIRTWRNMPDRTLGDIVLSLPRLIKDYATSVPTAWRAATGKPDDLIKEMENANIIGLTRNDVYGSPDTIGEEYISKVLQDIGAMPELKQSTIRTIPGIKYIPKLFDAVSLFGNFIERLPKVAGYKRLRGKVVTGEFSKPELAHYVRNYIGSPDFLNVGRVTPVSNNLFLFSNAAKEGIRGDINMAFRPKTKGGWWFKTLIGTVLPKLLQLAASLGLLGLLYKKMLDGVSEYDKTNYTIIPLGLDKNGKTIYIRLPNDESGRFMGAMVWKIGNIFDKERHQDLVSSLMDVFSLYSGQLPSMTPSITGGSALLTYLSGRNPYDSFRNRLIIPDTTFKAGFKYSFPVMLEWLKNNQGLTIVMPSYTPDGEMTNLEKILNLPVLSNVIGRFIKVSDYGKIEKASQIQKEVSKEASIKTLDKREKTNTALEKYLAGEKTDENYKDIAGQLVKDVLGHNPDMNNKEEVSQAKAIEKQFRFAVIAGSNPPEISNVVDATTNQAKAENLKILQETVPIEKFAELLKMFVKEGVVTVDTLIKYGEIMSKEQSAVPEKKKTALNLVKPAYAIEDKTITPTPAGKKTTYVMTNADGEQISVTPRNNKITEKVLRDNQELVDIIVKAASDFDIDPGLMLDMAYSESTFRANPPLNDNSPTQVVKGLFQWKEESWKMAKKALNDNIGDDRTDAKDNAIATAWALSTGKIRWWEANGNHIKWSKNYTTKELKKYGWRL